MGFLLFLGTTTIIISGSGGCYIEEKSVALQMFKRIGQYALVGGDSTLKTGYSSEQH